VSFKKRNKIPSKINYIIYFCDVKEWRIIDDRKLISFDWAIKRLLRNKADFSVLEGFLSTLLERDVQIVELLDPESNKQHASDRQVVVDVLCKTSNNTLVLIEVQFHHQLFFFHRIQYNAAKIISERLRSNQNFDQVEKVYAVNLVYFNLGRGLDYVYHGKMEFRGMNQRDPLLLSKKQQQVYNCTHPSDLFLEVFILKVNQFDDVAKSPLSEWIYYLKNETLPEHYTAKGLSLLDEQFKVSAMETSELKDYNKYRAPKYLTAEEVDYYLDEGREEGKYEGMALQKRAIIAKAFKQGLDLEFISDLVGMSMEEVLREVNNLDH